ncbi:MAG: adenylosuccinate synthase [Candidatus Woesearchaeota archaeon]|jgi:adenylosuccinate synthase
MVSIILGGQWGDEGKGKIVDVLAKDADIIVRPQGGANAGHTININGIQTVLHLIPSGIFYPHTKNVIGNGVVVDLLALKSEIDVLNAQGINFKDRLYISDKAHMIFPWHRIIDALHHKGKIGTTGRGIGPAYADKVNRVGIRFCDYPHEFAEKFDVQYTAAINVMRQFTLIEIQKLLEQMYQGDENFLRFYSENYLDKELIFAECTAILDSIQQYICNTFPLFNEAIVTGKKIVLEGAQGTFLDIDHGTYPFVTSSNTTAGGACTGSGIAPIHISEVYGIFKAYTTRVGTGPFPTELINVTGEKIRETGHEYGATTKRPRRCGWFDAVLARHSVFLNGMTHITITKLDVLDDFEEIQICVGYYYDGKITQEFPSNSVTLEKIKPLYITMSGWKSSTTQCKSFEELPIKAQEYVKMIEKTVQFPVSMISVGPEREQTFIL